MRKCFWSKNQGNLKANTVPKNRLKKYKSSEIYIVIHIIANNESY